MHGKKRKKRHLIHLTSRSNKHTIHNLKVKCITWTCAMHAQLHDINTTLCIIATAIKERFFYICCRNGKYEENTKPRITSKKRFNQKDSRKTNNTCLSRMYATFVTVMWKWSIFQLILDTPFSIKVSYKNCHYQLAQKKWQ